MNTIKTFFFLLVLTALLLAIGGAIGGTVGIIIALVFSLGLNFIMYWFSDKLALAMTRAHQVTEAEEPELFRLVREQSDLAGLPMPKVYTIENDSPNAFATGRNPQHATVAATTGIRRLLTREELGAVLAHEMAHVGNRDTLIMMVVAGIAGAISMIITMAQWSAMFGGFGGDRERGSNIFSFVMLFVIGLIMSIIVMLIQMAISRAREYQADATGARTSGKPYALASALEKLEAGAHARPMKVTEGVSHLFIVNPLSGRSLANLFSTHPPISERVRRLRDMTIRPNF